jgi:hypothetical protein
VQINLLERSCKSSCWTVHVNQLLNRACKSICWTARANQTNSIGKP